MEDLDQYNGDAEHDMWVDFNYHEPRRARGTKNEQSPQNTGELSEHFFARAKRQADYDDYNLDVYVDNLNDWD